VPVNLPDFSGLRVHVIGDAIRDVYTQAKCLGAASKSPTLVYEKLPDSMWWPGGAEIVARHCSEAGARVVITMIGSMVKERIVVDGVKVVEFHDRQPLIQDLTPRNWKPDVVILADFQHGTFTADTLPSWLNWATAAPVSAADSQTTDISWGNILDFAGCDLLFANEKEAGFAIRRPDDPFCGLTLWRSAGLQGTKAVFLKRGAAGLTVYSDGQIDEIPAYASQPIVDPIGAGDALLAYATLTYAVTKDLVQAGIIGSLAAAEACAHMGNVPVTLEAVKARAGALA
jgi:sugar/nucleoside kinase (ribokinase family)